MKKIFILIPALALILGACGGEKAGTEVKELSGAGATFPNPLYSKMFSEYNTKTQVKVNYQSIGSGGGIKQLQAKTVDFGASDAFLNEEETKNMGADVIHVPTCLGAVVITYNVPGNPKLKMSPEILGGIFSGSIKKMERSKDCCRKRWHNPS